MGRETIKEIGFDHPDKGIDYKTCEVLNKLHGQSPEIGECVAKADTRPEDVGAGDQGHMFGYASDGTSELMPLTHSLATGIGYKLTMVRKDGTLPMLRPDGKTQVTVEYKKNADGSLAPLRVHTIVISTQHDPAYEQDKLAADLKEKVIKAVVPAKYLDDKTIYHINPSGKFSIFVDSYGSATNGRKDSDLLKVIEDNFDCRAGMLVRELDMLKPKYKKTSCYGHFGNAARAADTDFTWETPKKLKV